MIKLYRHQELALNYMRLNDSFALFMEQGTGKTLPALCRLLELFKTGQISTALVVCPKSVIGSWERDIEKFTADKQKLLRQIVIINYDKVWKGKTYQRQWDAIVLDEAHSIKNRASKRAAFILRLSLTARYRYLLTGTPVSNGQLENLWSLMCFLNPYKDGRSICSRIFADADGNKGTYYDWCDEYAYLNQFHAPYAYHHVDRLQDLVGQYSYRVKKTDCLDLPDKLPDEIWDVELTDADIKRLYKDIAKTSASLEMDYVAENPMVRLLKLRQLASGYFQTEDGNVIVGSCEKLKVLSDYLENHDDKLVIFAEFKVSILRICETLERLKIKYVVLDGAQKNKSIWRQFQLDESIKVIVCQYQSGCQGIDLFAADTIIYYEPTLRSAILEQSRDRIHRQGQHRPCSYIHLLTKGTVEVSIYRALAGYADFNERLFSEYIREYKKGGKK